MTPSSPARLAAVLRPATPQPALLFVIACAAAVFAGTPVAGQSGSFGHSVLIHEGELLVAEPTTNFRPGAVYVYTRGEEGWMESGVIRGPDPEIADGFGTVLAAAGAFESVVLIAGGRNKGLDLRRLAGAASVRAVVAIGEAAGEVCGAFAGDRPVHRATNMEGAVAVAAELARRGEAILLSPGCTSFDWYGSYQQRGEHYASVVRAAVGEEA